MENQAPPAVTPASDVSAPDDLDVRRFRVESDEYAVFCFPLDQHRRHFTSEDRLTPSEREVLGLLIEGRSNGEIALARGTARSTIAKQVVAIFRKLGIGSRRELRARRP